VSEPYREVWEWKSIWRIIPTSRIFSKALRPAADE